MGFGIVTLIAMLMHMVFSVMVLFFMWYHMCYYDAKQELKEKHREYYHP